MTGLSWSPIQLACLICLSAIIITDGKLACDNKCFFGDPCWPSAQVVAVFVNSLKGEVVSPSDARYAKLNTMKNARVKKEPAMIVFVQNVDDIKKCVSFAKVHNLRVAIMSSGHSFTGRSTHDGSLLINMSNMTSITVRTDLTNRNPAGEITVETGNNWARVYEEVDRYGRLVVGGSAHTVAMGGYIQGGGHSPLSRSLGLAVDSVLEVQVVTANAELVTTNAQGTYNHDTGKRSSSDLFWALRGGGGGTWGVVVTFTLKLHMPPSGFVQFTGFYSMKVNGSTPGVAGLTSVVEKVKQLPRQWAGFVLTNNSPQPGQQGVVGLITVLLLHYGDWNSDSRAAIQPFMDDPMSVYNVMTNFSSFWEYEKDVKDADVSDMRVYTLNSFIQSDVSSAELAEVIVEEHFAGENPTSVSLCTFILTGGQMMDVNPMETPINPGFRSAMFALSCGRAWFYAKNDNYHIGHADRFSSRLIKLGKGVYFNEAAEILKNWKTDYWGKRGNYEKLLSVKRKWDRDNFFCCHNCVGSDLADYSNPPGQRPTSSANVATPMAALIMTVLMCLTLM